jgi:uncharacterized membrane protein
MTADPVITISWELAIARNWRKLALTCTSALALATVVWQICFRDQLYELVFRPDAISGESLPARRAFLYIIAVASALAAIACLWIFLRARRGKVSTALHWELLCTSCAVLPLLTVPAVEFEHAVFTCLLTGIFGLAVARAASREAPRFRGLPDLSKRQAHVLVGAGYAIFVGVVGFIAYWRYLTFHAEVCDTSYEVNAVAGIVRHGVPTLSIAAFFYDGQTLPAPYFNNHVPLADYLFAPFFLIYRQPSTVVWMQTVFMGAGTFGAYLLGCKWLDRRLGGVLFAWLYLLCPNVQGFCLHDIHANVLIIPCLVLAVGLMEAGYVKAALACALLSAICREEAPVYAIGLGLYWLFSSDDRRLFRRGLALVIVAAALQVFFSSYVMPHFGGQPRLDHFNLFYLPQHSAGSMLGALFLNPLGALYSVGGMKLDYLFISLVSMGGVALVGWRAGWFAVPALLLLVPAGDPGFFCLGSNYSAPLVPAAILMGFAGIRYFWRSDGEGDAALVRRAGIFAYVLTTALLANYLYGDIGSKSYKLEYGQSPLRRENQRNYADIVGYLDTLPPFGPVERALWQVIDRVPKNVPIATSWNINPQLSHFDVALELGYSGGNPPPEQRVRYVVIDKLPALQGSPEPYIVHFRRNSRQWRVFYENSAGVIFERR